MSYSFENTQKPHFSWVTKFGATITIDKEFAELHTNSLTRDSDIDSALSVVYYGRAAFPFFVALITGIFSNDFLYVFLATLAAGVISILNCFTPDDLIMLFMKYIFTIATAYSLRLFFFVVPIVFVFIRGWWFLAAYFGSFFILFVLYKLLDLFYRKHSIKKYELQNGLSLLDLKCLRKCYALSSFRGSFLSFIDQYRYETEIYIQGR